MPGVDIRPFENLEKQLPKNLKGLLEKGRIAIREYNRYLELREPQQKNGKRECSFREENSFKASF